MNSLEKVFVNNPFRSFMLRVLTTDLLGRADVSLRGKAVLEIGCCQGAGTDLLVRSCGADHMVAFDYNGVQQPLERGEFATSRPGERKDIIRKWIQAKR